MLLNIYLGTVALSWTLAMLVSANFEGNMKRKGYKFVKEKKQVSEILLNLIEFSLLFSIPVLNIAIMISGLYSKDDIFEKMEKAYLEKGKMYKPSEQELNNDFEIKTESKEETKKDSKEMAQNLSGERKFNEMSIDEQIAYLEYQREKLINERDNQNQKVFSKKK